MSLTCMERALALTDEEETRAEVWYNIGHIALAMGDTSLAYQCFRQVLSVVFGINLRSKSVRRQMPKTQLCCCIC